MSVTEHEVVNLARAWRALVEEAVAHRATWADLAFPAYEACGCRGQFYECEEEPCSKLASILDRQWAAFRSFLDALSALNESSTTQ